jgi:hypothetical protein
LLLLQVSERLQPAGAKIVAPAQGGRTLGSAAETVHSYQH